MGLSGHRARPFCRTASCAHTSRTTTSGRPPRCGDQATESGVNTTVARAVICKSDSCPLQSLVDDKFSQIFFLQVWKTMKCLSSEIFIWKTLECFIFASQRDSIVLWENETFRNVYGHKELTTSTTWGVRRMRSFDLLRYFWRGVRVIQYSMISWWISALCHSAHHVTNAAQFTTIGKVSFFHMVRAYIVQLPNCGNDIVWCGSRCQSYLEIYLTFGNVRKMFHTVCRRE